MSDKPVNKFKRDLSRTKSTFTPDPVVNRAEQIRRDTDVVKTPQVGLYHIDHAIKWYIENEIKPVVDEGGDLLRVPVMYASPEKWSSIQRQGFMRDSKGKIMTPLIAFRRLSMSPRKDIPHNKFIDDPKNRILFCQRYNKNNRYDAFSLLQNQEPVQEFYSLDIPDYVDVEYEVVIWADFTTQANKLVEQIIAFEGKAWGESYRFVTAAESYTFETVNTVGEDRIVRATLGLRSQAHLVSSNIGDESTLKKHHTTTRVDFGCEVVVDINNISTGSLA